MNRLFHFARCALPWTLSVLGPSGAWAEASEPDIYQRSYDHEVRTQWMAALNAFDAMPKVHRSSYTYVLRHAWLLHLNGKYTESIADYQRAVRLAPHALEPRLGLMLPQMALRQWRAVADTAEGALRIDPVQTTALARLAFALYNMGRYDEAEARYRKVLALYPADIDMHVGVGFCQLRQGAYSEALKTFRAAHNVAPRDARVKDGLAAATEAAKQH